MSLQLDDRKSASDDLYLVLRCDNYLFDSTIHEIAVQRLAAMQSVHKPLPINWGALLESEVIPCWKFVE